MKFLVMTLVFAFAGTALANETQVCFERNYSDSHLAKNPKQIVKSIRVTLTQEDHLYNSVEIRTRKPIKGTTKFSSGGACQIGRGGLHCGFDADGGNYILTDNGKTAVLKIKSALFLYRLDAGEDESEGRDLMLAAGATNGIYQLNSVPCK